MGAGKDTFGCTAASRVSDLRPEDDERVTFR